MAENSRPTVLTYDDVVNTFPAQAQTKEPKRVDPASFVEGGSEVDQIQVRISYGIIQRFSEGLYSSPNKAFEELVSNSYDAGAKRVWIELPSNLTAEGATVLVLDDGESMDLPGLRELWEIGKSPKRTGGPQGGERVIDGRDPIGKFGIGKLATYVLANELTYICRQEQGYLAVTMDYSVVSGDTDLSDTQPMELKVVELSAEEAQEAVRNALGGVASDAIDDFFKDEPEHWTAAIMANLKERGAREIQEGMLKWILRTALPVNPNFQLTFNNEPLAPSKAEGDRPWQWVVGESDKGDLAPKEWRYRDKCGTYKDETAVELENAGWVRGTAELYSNSLQRGKSEQWGRSHGFFVKVRGRLINLEDELFGIEVELHHGTFTRFRMEIDADGLDDYVASPRESIQDSAARREFRQYLLDVFNRGRAKQVEIDSQGDADSLAAADRISDAPAALSQKPLRRLLGHAIESRDQELLDLFSITGDEDVVAAEEVFKSDDNLLQSVEVDDLPDPHRLVGYDPGRRAIVVNSAHPFVRNYLGTKGATDVVRDIGAAELLTEAYLLDQDFPSAFVRRFLERRDALLRALTQVAPKSAPIVAQQLRDARQNEKELEDAVADALGLVGYEVRRIGGSGKPDGVATARLGRLSKGDEPADYSLTYDAKSVRSDKKEAIQAAKARTAILKVHRESEDADHTLLVAPDFEGSSDENSNLAKTCGSDGITPIRVDDLARLVELFPFRDVSPRTLRGMFDLHLPKDTQEFVEGIDRAAPDPPPIKSVLDVIADYSVKRDAVSIDAINAALNEREKLDLGIEAVEATVRGLRALAPRSIYFDDGVVSLNASVDAVMDELLQTLDPLPKELTLGYRRALAGEAK
jgi:hypothetical protein